MSDKVRSKRLRALVLAALCSVAVSAVGAETAIAGSFTYCNGCTIAKQGGTKSSSPTVINAVNNYVHRLSGPSSGVGIISYTIRNSDGKVQCSSGLTTSTVAQCDPGGVVVLGVAVNGGAGNYGFNAHLTQ